MAMIHKHATTPSFADRILASVEEYRAAPDRHERDRRYIAKLQDDVRAYEQRYNLKSSEIHDRIDDGTLAETIDVSHWIFAVNKLERAKTK
jgi:hypothetical protein